MNYINDRYFSNNPYSKQQKENQEYSLKLKNEILYTIGFGGNLEKAAEAVIDKFTVKCLECLSEYVPLKKKIIESNITLDNNLCSK